MGSNLDQKKTTMAKKQRQRMQKCLCYSPESADLCLVGPVVCLQPDPVLCRLTHSLSISLRLADTPAQFKITVELCQPLNFIHFFHNHSPINTRTRQYGRCNIALTKKTSESFFSAWILLFSVG